jgi:integrase
VFPLTDDLRALLEERRRAKREAERATDRIIPWVFFRMVASERGGEKSPKRIRAFTKAWKAACIAAGFLAVSPTTFDEPPSATW